MKKVAKKERRNKARKRYVEVAMSLDPGVEAKLAAIQAFILVYRIKAKRVEILALIHSSRMWPENLLP